MPQIMDLFQHIHPSVLGFFFATERLKLFVSTLGIWSGGKERHGPYFVAVLSEVERPQP